MNIYLNRLDLYVLLILIIALSAFSEDKSNPSAITASVVNYEEITSRLNNIKSQIPDPKKLEVALQAVLNSDLLKKANQDGWQQIRFNSAHIVFTNLCLLETGIRQTAPATNNLMPPDNAFLTEGNETPLDGLTNTDARNELLAYRSALKASSELWNLHQDLKAKYNIYAKPAIDLLVSAYSHQPLADVELKNVLANYGGNDCVLQFSNRFYKIQK